MYFAFSQFYFIFLLFFFFKVNTSLEYYHVNVKSLKLIGNDFYFLGNEKPKYVFIESYVTKL